MAIRRREKPLTPKEAIELAQKELRPYWIGSEPLLAAAKGQDGRVTAYPLDPQFAEKASLLAFVDPTELSFSDIVHYSGEWASRYEQQKLSIILFVKSRFAFVQDRDWLLHRTQGGTHGAPGNLIRAVDVNGLMAAAFDAKSLPTLVLLCHGQKFFERAGARWFDGAELGLQNCFRSKDPGLPLFPVLETKEPLAEDLPGIDFGANGNFDALTVHGEWKREADHWVTGDPNATISFENPGKRLGVIARCPAGNSEILVETSQELGKETQADQDLEAHLLNHKAQSLDPAERRRGAATIAEIRLYRLLKNIPAGQRVVTLRFPAADRASIGLYGLRFAN